MALDLLLILRLPAVPAAVAGARRAVGSLGPEFLDDGVIEDVQLLVSELLTNCLRHSGLSGAQTVEVSLRASPQGLLVEVADGGRGFAGRRPKPQVAPERFEGWGLLLVDRIADRWGIVEDGDTRVWFELQLDGRGRGAHGRVSRSGRGRGKMALA